MAARVALYATPTDPLGSGEAVVMDTGVRTAIERLFEAVAWVGVVVSVTVTAIVPVPAVVGVPLITPVDVLRMSPAGNPVADHV